MTLLKMLLTSNTMYETDQRKTLKFPGKHKSLALFHTMLVKQSFDDRDHLLKYTNKTYMT